MRISQLTGLSIHVHEPLVRGGSFIRDYSDMVDGYGHELGANGGCLTASIQLSTNHIDAQDWFANGLGRNIRIYNPAGSKIWQGFVNVLTVTVGALAGETRGPLMDIGNRVSAVYSPLDVSVYPPVAGSATVTTISENTASQALYGIIEKVLSAGTCTDDDAEYARDTYLVENAYPVINGDISPESSANISISLDCIGYDAWLSAYIYDNTSSGFATLSAKIISILGADPNGFILSDTSGITENLFLTYAAENQNRFARDIIDSILSVGDVNNRRWLFGVNQDRRAFYVPAPTDIIYELKLSDQRQRILSAGNEVYPWDVKAGQWIKVSDFITGYNAAISAPYTTDASRKFIDVVRYTAPWSVSLASGPSGTLAQLLAKFGGS